MVSAAKLLSTIALVLPLIPAAPGRAGDWPQWRGPNRDGVWRETGVLETFPSTGLKARWRVSVGVGFSSPVVSQGTVYLSDAELVRPKARERLHALDAAAGAMRWSYAYEVDYPDWAFDEKSPRGPTSTPIAANGRIYSLGSLGHLICLDAINGAVLWKRDLAAEHPGKELRCNASPLIDGELLIVFVGGISGACLLAFDIRTGREVWTALAETATNSSPIVMAAGETRQLIVWTEESVASLDASTGKTRWRLPLNATAEYVVSTPVFYRSRLLLGGLMLSVDSDKSAPAVLWPEKPVISRRILSNTSTALLQSDLVFSAKSSGQLVAMDAATGKQLWETDKVTDVRSGASIHITVNGDAAFLFTERGELIRAQLMREGYREVSRAVLIEPTYPFGGRKCAWAPPAFADRCVFARSDQSMVCASLDARPASD